MLCAAIEGGQRTSIAAETDSALRASTTLSLFRCSVRRVAIVQEEYVLSCPIGRAPLQVILPSRAFWPWHPSRESSRSDLQHRRLYRWSITWCAASLVGPHRKYMVPFCSACAYRESSPSSQSSIPPSRIILTASTRSVPPMMKQISSNVAQAAKVSARYISSNEALSPMRMRWRSWRQVSLVS